MKLLFIWENMAVMRGNNIPVLMETHSNEIVIWVLRTQQNHPINVKKPISGIRCASCHVLINIMSEEGERIRYQLFQVPALCPAQQEAHKWIPCFGTNTSDPMYPHCAYNRIFEAFLSMFKITSLIFPSVDVPFRFRTYQLMLAYRNVISYTILENYS